MTSCNCNHNKSLSDQKKCDTALLNTIIIMTEQTGEHLSGKVYMFEGCNSTTIKTYWFETKQLQATQHLSAACMSYFQLFVLEDHNLMTRGVYYQLSLTKLTKAQLRNPDYYNQHKMVLWCWISFHINSGFVCTCLLKTVSALQTKDAI